MTESQVFERLCLKDSRHPLFEEMGWKPPRDQPRTENCSCDNCFYGRDEMALEILRLREEMKGPRERRHGPSAA